MHKIIVEIEMRSQCSEFIAFSFEVSFSLYLPSFDLQSSSARLWHISEYHPPNLHLD